MEESLLDDPDVIEAAAVAAAEADALIAAWNLAAAPPPQLTVSEWADAHRMLPESSSAQGGRWRTSTTPYLRGVMDCVHEPGVKKVALMKSAQVGGTEALKNIIGYSMQHDPCSMLLVEPAEGVAEEFSKEQLADMIRSTPALYAVVDPLKSTLMKLMFPGGYLALGGANTPNTFARRSVRKAFGDDVDRFPPVVGEEGDPEDLLNKRTTTFHDGLLMMVSTPTLKGGRIDTLFQRSDQRRYFVQCPECGREDWITWSDPKHFNIVWENRDPDSARLACPSEERGGCGAQHDEATRRHMVADGTWRPTTVAKDLGLVGFHLPAMVTTLGNASMSAWVADWLTARDKGKESTRVFINTTLGEAWEDRGSRQNPNLLINRRERYGDDGVEVPAGAVAITAGVDVQDNRFEVQVTAWGPATERWVIDWRTIPGNPKHPDTRAQLLEALSRKYRHACGVDLPIHSTCVDTGYATQEMYDFVLAYQSRRIYATKGRPGQIAEPIVSKPSEKRHGKSERPVRLYLINTDEGKGDVMSALSLAAAGPGYMHFPLHVDTIDEEYFAQLCAEHKETRYNKQKVATHSVWVQDRDRNEALDTAVLCLAAFKLFNPNIRQMLDALKAVAPTQPTPPVPAAAVTLQPPNKTERAPAPPGRRMSRSSYLSR